MTTEFLIAGAIFILTSIPLWLGKIPPNRLYGIRIPRAFESTELWYKVNALGGGIMILYGNHVVCGSGVILSFQKSNCGL
jgi:hypothetical protein